ncbi:MAG: Transcription regulatory membrane protein, HTH-AraC family [candidate division TA06 bacterium 34_109]|uniref:Transcription regulatory membrane protein, HTH-AraC family n=1 Tax=candidate division TA06 bacterium 34_109 TaxID=1635277 RepID=A0A117M5R2_UNCT6|nr:MAG: Transcription regulatory membrane protein, HTH-AraC family [candidate division TA06 bacterium 34_109]
MDAKEKEGIILVIICVFIHGSQPILGKYGVSLVPPLFFASLTNLIAAVFLILLILARRENIFLLLKARYFLTLLSIGFFGTTLSNVLFFYGVRLTSGINSAILLQIEPIYALLIGYLLLKERINSRQIIATLFIILGTLLVVYQGTSTWNWGDILILLTPICYQISHFFSKQLLNKTDLNPLFIATGRTLFIFYGIVVYALSYLTFYEAIKRINLSKASAIISVYPAISILLAWFILKEVPDWYQLTGFFIILLGIFYLSQVKSELRS